MCDCRALMDSLKFWLGMPVWRLILERTSLSCEFISTLALMIFALDIKLLVRTSFNLGRSSGVY